jgi:putative restriction endonuclease
MASRGVREPDTNHLFPRDRAGRYQAILSTFISGWDAKALKARVAFGLPNSEALEPPENALERRYALRTVKQRLHQASFREAVITAYNGRCALSGLPEPLLLDAAHIVADKHERFGQPLVPNGIPLSKIHHAAFDAHLIGIDPDYRLHVSERLLGQNDGPMLEALKRLNGGTIHLPNRTKDLPDRERLALRFERFRAGGVRGLRRPQRHQNQLFKVYLESKDLGAETTRESRGPTSGVFRIALDRRLRGFEHRSVGSPRN